MSTGNQKSETGNALVECVPNFSEGRNAETVAELVRAVESVDGTCVLDHHLDADHNRSVITFVAPPAVIVDAAVAVVSRARDLIDMRRHQGEHPRLGATDVLPFVPISGVTMEQCAGYAHEAGQRVAELGIPVYFYESAALRTDRVNLEDVRRGALELLREQIAVEPTRAPDLGPLLVHETAGAIAIAARPFLIAFNVNLNSADVTIAKKIARTVRARHGGLPFVKALGFTLSSRGLVQVSMNLVNYEATGMDAAYAAVRDEAQNLGVQVAGTEIVGLVPEKAIDSSAEYFQKLEKFSEDKILEHRIAACFQSRN